MGRAAAVRCVENGIFGLACNYVTRRVLRRRMFFPARLGGRTEEKFLRSGRACGNFRNVNGKFHRRRS
jgi:hypothetical protein